MYCIAGLGLPFAASLFNTPTTQSTIAGVPRLMPARSQVLNAVSGVMGGVLAQPETKAPSKAIVESRFMSSPLINLYMYYMPKVN
jgi:hypothetical protein